MGASGAMRHFAEHRNVRGTSLYTQRWLPDGEPAGVVALVHGLGEHSGRYARVAAALTGAGYAVCAFDLRGHGRSPGRRGDTRFGPALEDIDELLDDAGQRFGDRPQFLYGHSLGGLLVLSHGLARRRAVAGVVCSGPALRSPLREQRAK